MASAIDITKPVYGNPTTQSVRDNFEHAYDEITSLQTDVMNRVAKAGDTMNGMLSLFADPTLAMHATNRSWVINQIRSTANAIIYVGDYDAAADRVLTSGQQSIVVGQPLPVATTGNAQMYFTAKTGSATPIGNQPAGGVPVGCWLISNGTSWNVYQPSAAGVIAQTVPVNPPIVGLPGGTVYDALGSVPTLYLPKAGGTVTGNLTLALAPTLDGHAATKFYVDNHTYTPPTDPIVNSLTLNNAASWKTLYGKKANLTQWTLNLGNGGAVDDLTIDRYDNAGVLVDNTFTIRRSDGASIIRHGLAFTSPSGEMPVISGRGDNPPNTGNDCLFIQARSDVASAQVKLIGPTNSNFPGSVSLVGFTPGGGPTAYTQYIFSKSNANFGSYIYFDNSAGVNMNGMQFSYGGNIYQTSDNSLILQRNAGNRIVLSTDGSTHIQGGNNYTSCVYFLPTYTWFNGDVQVSNGNVISNQWTCDNQTQFYMSWSGVENLINQFSGMYYYANVNTYNVGYYAASVGGYTWRRSDHAFTNGGTMEAYAFNVVSDEKMKMDIQSAGFGLKEIIGINPITYYQDRTKMASVKPFIEYKPEMSPEEELEYQRVLADAKSKEWAPELQFGFSAQQVQSAFPQAVHKFEQDEPDSMLSISLVAVVAGLVNAVKELNKEVIALQRRQPR